MKLRVQKNHIRWKSRFESLPLQTPQKNMEKNKFVSIYWYQTVGCCASSLRRNISNVYYLGVHRPVAGPFLKKKS